MNQILIAIFFFLFIIGFGFTGAKHFSHVDEQDDPELGPLLGASQKPNTDEPVVNPHKGYIFEIMSRGFDVTSQTLFGNLSLGALKKNIFPYNYTDRFKTTKKTSSDGKVVYWYPRFLKEFNEELGTWPQTKIYKFENELNDLMNATKASFEPRNYSSQVFESSHYGRVSAESIYFIGCWEAMVEFSLGTVRFIERDFENAVLSLPEEYNETTQEQFANFIQDYGTHYLTYGKFGGMLHLESKTNERFVEDVSESVYREYLQENLERVFDDKNATRFNKTIPRDFYYHNHYNTFTYGGNESDITCRDDVKAWKETIEFNPVLIDAKIANFSVIIKTLHSLSNASNAFSKALDILLKKYTIRSYLDALEVVNANLYGHAMAGHFNPVKLMEYFRLLLDEFDPTFNSTFEDNCWCARHCVESIMNRRNWFPKPLPTKLTKATTVHF